MSEDLLKFLWCHRLYGTSSLVCHNGDSLEVINPGIANFDAGPDFFNAQVKIGDTLWSGNVELHVKASDWYLHNHHVNSSYNNVVLHVVFTNDKAAITQSGRELVAVSLTPSEAILQQYKTLLGYKKPLPCQKAFNLLSQPEKVFFLEKLMIEKLEHKSTRLFELLDFFKGDWHQLLFTVLSRSFGFSINGDAFEQMALNTPVLKLLQHVNNQLQVEAILFGQVGLLNEMDYDNAYCKQLKSEYQFLSKKYNLKSCPTHLSKFLRLRPSNFPTIRLSQLADFIVNQGVNPSMVADLKNSSNCRSLLSVKASQYWDTHYCFGEENGVLKQKNMGVNSQNSIIINAIAPFIYAYGKHRGDEELQNSAIDLLAQLPAEKISQIDKWQEFKEVGFKTSAETQGMLWLVKQYCSHKKCLQCMLGYNVLKSIAN